MREIKFRAWVKSKRKMYHDVRVGSGGMSIYGFKKEYPNEWVYFHPEDIQLMQYTGLKDKNGKEIYEGDIVYCALLSDRYGSQSVIEPIACGEIKYVNGAFIIDSLREEDSVTFYYLYSQKEKDKILLEIKSII